MCESNVEPAVIRVLCAYIRGFLVDRRMLASTRQTEHYAIVGMLLPSSGVYR